MPEEYDGTVYRVTYVYEVEVPPEARGQEDAKRYARNKGELVDTEVEEVDDAN